VGGEVTRGSLSILAPEGTLVIYGALNIQSFDLGVPELVTLIFKNQALLGFAFVTLLTPEGLKEDPRALFDLAVRGELKVPIGGRHAFGEAAEAHRALASRGTLGKLVLMPEDRLSTKSVKQKCHLLKMTLKFKQRK
jgi:NADPH2:quinone reductase